MAEPGRPTKYSKKLYPKIEKLCKAGMIDKDIAFIIGVNEDTFHEWKKKHKDFSCIRHTDFRLNKYSEGGFMSRHLDNIHHSHGQQYGYPQVSALLFLNDDYEGGEFIVAKEVYKTSKGSAIIFPSNFMFPHEVTTIRKGVRWSVVTWMM